MPKFDATESAAVALPSPFLPVPGGLRQIAPRLLAHGLYPPNASAFVYRAGPTADFDEDRDYETDGAYAELSGARERYED